MNSALVQGNSAVDILKQVEQLLAIESKEKNGQLKNWATQWVLLGRVG